LPALGVATLGGTARPVVQVNVRLGFGWRTSMVRRTTVTVHGRWGCCAFAAEPKKGKAPQCKKRDRNPRLVGLEETTPWAPGGPEHLASGLKIRASGGTCPAAEPQIVLYSTASMSKLRMPGQAHEWSPEIVARSFSRLGDLVGAHCDDFDSTGHRGGQGCYLQALRAGLLGCSFVPKIFGVAAMKPRSPFCCPLLGSPTR